MEKDILGSKKIAMIGAGHMGQAIVKGFINSGKIKRSNIFISNKLNNATITKKADYIFIVVKPLIVEKVLKEIKPFIKNKIILSVAGAVSLKKLLDYSSLYQKIIRLMPNIPVSENKGVIGFYANKNVSNSEKNNTYELVSLLGKVIKVKKEKDLNTITLVSGCGPAISAYFINLISNYAIKKGFSEPESIDLALKIFKGTTDYLQNNNLTPSELIKLVATKGGITEEIINYFNENNLNKFFEKAMKKGHRKIRQVKEKLKQV